MYSSVGKWTYVESWEIVVIQQGRTEDLRSQVLVLSHEHSVLTVYYQVPVYILCLQHCLVNKFGVQTCTHANWQTF